MSVFYTALSSDHLKDLLDNNQLQIRDSNIIRSILLERFKQENEVNNVGIKNDDDGDDYESYLDDCDVCDAKSNVYDTHGYSSVHEEIFDLGSVCHDCICVEYNGID